MFVSGWRIALFSRHIAYIAFPGSFKHFFGVFRPFFDILGIALVSTSSLVIPRQLLYIKGAEECLSKFHDVDRTSPFWR